MNFEEEINNIINLLKGTNLKIKIYGAIGVKLYSEVHSRSTFDLDLFALSEEKFELIDFFKKLDYNLSSSKRRTDLVFFKKHPVKVKIDVELDKLKVFDKGISIDFKKIISMDGIKLPSHVLFITKLLGRLDDDNIYDIAHILSEANPEIDELIKIIDQFKIKDIDLDKKISSLPDLILKNKRIENKIKSKSLKYVKLLKNALRL